MDPRGDEGTSGKGIVRKARRALPWLLAALVLVSAIGVQRSLSARQSGSPGAGQSAPGDPAPAGAIHALARLEPASGLVIVGARPGARIDRIPAAQGDLVKPGQVLAILEGHDQALAQLALAEAQKQRAEHQRPLQKQKLALEREQFDRLQTAKLESAQRVFGSKQRWSEIEALYKQLVATRTCRAKDRLDIMLRYYQAETENLRGELEVKSFEIAQKLVPDQRKLEDQELGDKGPDIDLLDRQIDLARTGLVPDRGEGADRRAGSSRSSPTRERSPAARCSSWATSRSWWRPPRSTRPTSPGSRSATRDGPGPRSDRDRQGHPDRLGRGQEQLVSLDPRALQDRRVVKVTISLDDPELARTVGEHGGGRCDQAVRGGRGGGVAGDDRRLIGGIGTFAMPRAWRKAAGEGDRAQRGGHLVSTSNSTPGAPERGPRRPADRWRRSRAWRSR